MAAVFDEAVQLVAVRNRFGGPAPDPMDEAIGVYRNKAAFFEAKAKGIAEREAKAAKELGEKFQALAGAL